MPGPSPDTRENEWSYVEAILEWGERGLDPSVERWLAERGFSCLPMRAGLLVTGNPVAFKAAFGVDVQRVDLPLRIELPEELRGSVSSLTIPRPREIQG
jgi:hypothetical protein